MNGSTVGMPTFTLATGRATSTFHDARFPVAVTVTDRFAVLLTTGGRGQRSRIEHARVLRVARWARRRQRREGIPAKTWTRTTHFPRMWIDEINSQPSQVG